MPTGLGRPRRRGSDPVDLFASKVWNATRWSCSKLCPKLVRVFRSPSLRLEGSVHGQSEAHQEKTEMALTPWPPCAARRPRRPAWPYCPTAGCGGGSAAVRSPKLGHHHRRSHDGSYSLPLGWPIGFLASFRGLLVCINFYIS